MDKRLELNARQEELVNQLGQLLSELEEENVGIIADYYYSQFRGFYFFNATDVVDFHSSKEYSENYIDESDSEYHVDGMVWYIPEEKDITYLPFNTEYEVDIMRDDWFTVLLEKNADVDIFYKEREKTNKIASFTKKLNILKDKLQKFEDAVTEGANNLHLMEEKGLPIEILDEERANMDANKVKMNELQQEIIILNSEIRKTKAIRTK
jgi:hypothetical protein